MCGRYTLTGDAEAIGAAFAADVEPIRADHRARYNIAPTEAAPVVIAAPGGRRAGPMRWGLHRRRAKRKGGRVINVRAETVARGAFREAFGTRRCLVPTDGFYEWQSRPSGKQPWWIHRPQASLFAMAGIWSFSSAPDGARIATFAILTRDAPSSMCWLHHRVPVVVPQAAQDDWLAPGTVPSCLTAILLAAEPPELQLHAVSRAVNRAGYDQPDCIVEVGVTQ